MRLFLNALGASCASGLTHLRNVIPQLSRFAGVETTLAANPEIRSEFADLPNISLPAIPPFANSVKRFWFEQTVLPDIVRRSKADILISTGNFALRHSPVPQILLSGNSLYTSQDFRRDLWSRKDYRLWLDNHLKSAVARHSIHWADLTIAPSQSFADELRRWTGKPVECIYHGFSPSVFFAQDPPLPSNIREQLDAARNHIRLLFVSHYNYYRNFETLLRALPIVRKHSSQPVRLFLTCEFRHGANPGSYRPEQANALLKELGLQDEVVQLGAVPYHLLHQVYRAADIYVTPSYAETFAHPLVEAMACGLPVVASDLPVHREICRNAALYFHRFSPETLAEQVLRLVGLSARQQFAKRGSNRAIDFTWQKHIEQLLAKAHQLLGKRNVIENVAFAHPTPPILREHPVEQLPA